MPIVILNEHKNAYLDALEAADHGNYQAFGDFISARSLDTIKLVEENLRSAISPSAEETFGAIQRLYMTRGGYPQEQVDAAGLSLVELLAKEVQRASARFQGPRLAVRVAIERMSYPPFQDSYRVPLHGGRGVKISMTTPAPANATTQREYWLEVPKDAADTDDVVLTNAQRDTFTARLDELLPTLSGMFATRMGIFAERIVGDMLAELSAQAEKTFRVT